MAKEIILPAAINLASTIIGEKAAEKLKYVPLSYNIVCRRIGGNGVGHSQSTDR